MPKPQLPSLAVTRHPTAGPDGRQLVRCFLKRGKRAIGPAISASGSHALRRAGVVAGPPTRSLLIANASTRAIVSMRSLPRLEAVDDERKSLPRLERRDVGIGGGRPA